MLKETRRSRVGGPIVGLVAIVALVALAGGLAFKLLNPFKTTTRDHSPPPVLQELRDLADFHAAQAEFEVVVDQEKDVRFLPQAIAGERVQYVAVGTVDAFVDFTGLGDANIAYSADNKAATITLPAARLGQPVLDPQRSHVMNRDRGLLNRIGGLFSDNPTSESTLQKAAQAKMADAAAQAGLADRAQENTERTLRAMLHSFGVDQVTVVFDPPPATSSL